MDTAVEVDNLVVRRGSPRAKKTVLHGLSFTVPTGAVTGVLGPSGSGKTTLLRCLVGVQKIKSGTVKVLGASAGSRGLRSKLGYLTQAPSVYGELTVAENARYFASLQGVSKADALQAVEEVGLHEQASQQVRTLSGGQHARASLAVALLGHPPILVLDEPTVGLDPVLRRDLWQLFRGLVRDKGCTLLVSSHVMDEAARCDRLLLLRDGKLIYDDSPESLRESTGTHDLDEAFLRVVERASVEKPVEVS
jgi:ABC-2 type transport system ATP-binding protein